jgi:hypothetical protein
VESARQAMVGLQQAIMQDNFLFSREQQLVVRCGIHFGSVLTDGTVVTGDAVNLCARVAALAVGGEIKLTRAAFQELSPIFRLHCRDMKMVELKGIGRPVEVLTLDWRDASKFPSRVLFIETGKEFQLPDQDIISFGRLRELKGVPANDIILELQDPQMTLQISRWQFELRRRSDGFVLRSVTNQITEVDGVSIAKGQEVPLFPGMGVRVARLLTLEFKTEARRDPSRIEEAPSTNYRQES